MGVFFAILIAAELLRGVRFDRRVVAVVVAVAVAAAAANLSLLHRSWVGLTQFGELQPGGLAALEIARDEIDPRFLLTSENSGVDYLGELDAGSYLSAADEFGSPAYTEAELAGASEIARVAADQVFGAGLEIALGPPMARGGPPAPAPKPVGATVAEPAAPGCVRVALADQVPAVLSLPPGGVELRATADAAATLALHRYAETSFPVEVGALDRGETAGLAIPVDDSHRPWELSLSGRGEITACGTASG
jgi:hypothetical protein